MNLKEQSGNTPNYFLWGVKNIAVAAVFLLFLTGVVEKQPAYNWLYNSLLKGNMETIQKYPDLTLDERFGMKLGFGYSYLHYLKQQTPEDAVILYPGHKQFYPEGKKSPFNGEVYNKIWATRFLYPRKVIPMKEWETSPYRDKITHIAIVNGQGFDEINYQGKRFEHGVLPLNSVK